MKKIIEELNNKMENIKNLGWIESKFKGTGAIGLTFEKLIGKEIENFEIPDYKGIEIKTKLISSNPYIRLFCASPDSYLFEIQRIHKEYGIFNKDNKKVFYLCIKINEIVSIKNQYYFKLIVDRNKKKIILNILDNFSGNIDRNVSWSFDLLTEKIQRKLTYLAVIEARRKIIKDKIYFKYVKLNLYKLKDPNTLIELINSGIIKISFNITEKYNKYGEKKIYDHGTNFIINKNDLTKLFNRID